MVIRNWRDVTPVVGHDTKIIWSIFRAKGREGDAVHIPPRVKHQIFNDGDDWIEHLIISAQVEG